MDRLLVALYVAPPSPPAAVGAGETDGSRAAMEEQPDIFKAESWEDFLAASRRWDENIVIDDGKY